MILRGLLVVLALAVALAVGRAEAHALDPGFLDLQPLGEGQWRVTWRKPQVQGSPMQIDAVLPAGCAPERGPAPKFDGRAFVTTWLTVCETGLAGGTIQIEGLEATRTDVLVRYTLEPDGITQSRRLTPDEPMFEVPEPTGRLGIMTGYFGLGVDHILAGVDHLLFVFAILLLVRTPRRIAGVVTSFTVAHSITLAAAALGAITVPVMFVEALIALSIAILAVELVRDRHGELGITGRYPWTVAFAFGLLHGLGFANALVDLGLPQTDIPLALLAFNLGVEAGQLLFVAVVLTAWVVLSRGLRALSRPIGDRGVAIAVAGYVIGALAMYWTIDRVAGFVT